MRLDSDFLPFIRTARIRPFHVQAVRTRSSFRVVIQWSSVVRSSEIAWPDPFNNFLCLKTSSRRRRLTNLTITVVDLVCCDWTVAPSLAEDSFQWYTMSGFYVICFNVIDVKLCTEEINYSLNIIIAVVMQSMYTDIVSPGILFIIIYMLDGLIYVLHCSVTWSYLHTLYF